MTTLTATFQAGSGSVPPAVLLAVAAAPSLSPVYASNFATTDGWAATQSGTLSLVTPASGIPSARMLSRPDNLSTFTRTVTGLTVGQVYELSLFYVTATGRVGLGVAGIGQTAYVYNSVRSALKYTFTATATSHVLNVIAYPNPTIGTDYGDVTVDTVVVRRTTGWQGTTIRRTDANGAGVPVRTPAAGLDATGPDGSATMTLTDYEQALAGPVTYTVTDGNGGTATTSPFAGSGADATNLVINPSLETAALVTPWTPWGSGTSQGRRTDYAAVGTASLGVTTGTSTLSGTYCPVTTGIVVGKTYGARARVRADTLSDLKFTVQFLDAGGALLTYAEQQALAVPAGAWVTLSAQGTAPAGCTQARVWVQRFNSSTAGVELRVDAVLLREIPAGSTFDPADYFDGSSGIGCYWTGTPNQSTSVRASTNALDPGVWVSLPATAYAPGAPSAVPVTAVTGISESARSNGTVHVVVGRADPLVNAGPLSTRAGTFDTYCPDYATADALRVLLAGGAVGLLRQPSYPGLDLYFTVTQVDVVNETPTPAQRWKASVGFLEVLPP